MINQKDLIKLINGEQVYHFLLLRKMEVKTSKQNKNYLSIEVGDHTTFLNANVWENFTDFAGSATIGCVIKVAGIIEEYKGQLQIKVNKIRCSVPADNVSPEEFIPKSKRDLEEMRTELLNRVEKVNNSWLKTLLLKVLCGPEFEKFVKAPAGKAWHHSYLHGLLEHTLEIVRICDLMCDIHPEVHRDLLISGAMLHDFGKVEELSFNNVFDYSDKGRLLGHIVIAAMDINQKISEIPDFPEDLKNQLLHLVLSHQGKLEFASPVIPKTLESIILYQSDELSAKTNAYKSAIQNECNGIMKWTKYIPLIATSLYIPDDFGTTNNEEPKTLFD